MRRNKHASGQPRKPASLENHNAGAKREIEIYSKARDKSRWRTFV